MKQFDIYDRPLCCSTGVCGVEVDPVPARFASDLGWLSGQEAGRLQEDLRRAGIEPYAWVINNSLAATGTTDPILRWRAAAESEHIEQIARKLATRTFIAPWGGEDPHGPESLKALARGVAGVSV